ncbi:MAG: hypothetical protein KF787_06070 [Phycisphaeraceae bacterium]|nr:hypothetical protein [Phycisphaerae bacterium]MBX3392196.1 hypothetical protein [Phycisphaeraceae bacterium]
MTRFPAILLALAAALTGCARSGSPTVQIPAGSYSQAFEATRASLRDFDFSLDRVDAASGVITTATKASSGLATPWDPEQSGLDQEWEDFINRQRRFVRVTFVPADQPVGRTTRDPAAAKAADQPDLRDFDGPVVARVAVTVERIQRPGWRVNTKSINQSTFTRDPSPEAASKYPTYAVELEPDTRLATRIASTIRAKLNLSAAPADEPPTAPPAPDSAGG